MQDEFGVPEIYEQEAQGSLAYLFQDVQLVLKVPVVNFIFRTLGLYRDFLDIAWGQVRPNMLTVDMEKAAGKLRFPNLYTRTQPHKEWKHIYDEHTIEKIRKIIFTFNYVNPKLLLIASAWAESLSGRTILGKTYLKGFIEPGIIAGLPEINLVKIPQLPPLQGLLEEIMEKHHAFDLASDFRALVNYPEFLSMSWNYLKPHVGSDEYNLLKSQLKSESIKIVREMPFPISINRRMLPSIYSASEIAGIIGIISLFQDFLPSLIIDGELLRRMF
ncbi:hypothetical protein J7E71_12520 [Mesobacillus foraminis]|uniref:halocarboxylic acid dehydrogenase DehI family protein n=1 Tax=Mesobacillus foraminis TaxID=279826 RepID=UPI001BE8A122|nr:halocarboxylic acid dehydrogenase DehI family protein [Mesobacillus foraminis]MBT2756779.1 hypothetical protein [Mesobacillus foraminis]